MLIPLGSTEIHGPLPMGLDTILAESAARAAAERLDCALAPTLPFGHSPEHLGPGVIWVDAEVYSTLVWCLLDSLSPFRILVLVNGHAGNLGLVEAVSREFRRENPEAEVLIADLWSLAAERFGRSLRELCRVEASLALFSLSMFASSLPQV